VTVVVIGPRWLTVPGPTGRPRLHDALDPLRIEVRTALMAGIPLLPVLVDTAKDLFYYPRLGLAVSYKSVDEPDTRAVIASITVRRFRETVRRRVPGRRCGRPAAVWTTGS
jgi:hypothetical protein